ncbi:hypothetical protein GWK47_029737 [Chionoecetes opilio]|uniref:Uncharacterized protein n=1 Tax=Chionoecetes opilio TaxID=41210 RepID=A0A8J4YKH2_CHIOP|nr:hypothetical protein GWK47_029737 [Chionoecetes opilio]
MGSRGSGIGVSFDTTGSNTRAPETGPVSSSNRKRGKNLRILPVVTYRGLVGNRCRPCSWVFPLARASVLKTFPKPQGEHRPGGLRHGKHGGGSGDVLEESRMRLFEDLQVLQEREDLRDDYREFGQNFLISSVVPLPGGIRFSLSPGATPGQGCQKSSTPFKILGFRGQFRFTKKEERGLQRLCFFVSESTQRPGLRFFLGSSPRLDLELTRPSGKRQD